jgi:hypothetical protein
VPRARLHVLHYTLGPLKPWHWWSSWLVAENLAWQEVRARLPLDASGRAAGRSGRQVLAETWLPLLPAAGALLAALAGSTGAGKRAARALRRLQLPGRGAGAGAGQARPLLPLVVGASLAVGYSGLGLAVLLVLVLVPPETSPAIAWALAAEWGLGSWFGGYLLFLELCRGAPTHWGQPPRPRPWRATAACAAAVGLPLAAAPWAARLLGVRSFVGALLAAVLVAIAASVALTASLVLLPLLWCQQLSWCQGRPQASSSGAAAGAAQSLRVL